MKIFVMSLVTGLFLTTLALAENPLVTNIYTADPEARVYGDTLYVYTSHDQPNATYWDMIDWRLLSTTDMVTWKDHGSVVSLKVFPWATKWAWAPDSVYTNGKFYLVLPVDRAEIGVAVGDTPDGPFKDAIGKPLIDKKIMPDAGEEPIDPAVLIDDDGQVYLYFASRTPKVVKVDPSMTKLAGPIHDISLLDAKGQPVPVAKSGAQPVLPEGYGEAPFMFKRGSKYYFVYSNGWDKTSAQVYAMGDNPMGPFTYAGPVMEHAAGVTQHGSVIDFHGKWYVFYHNTDLSKGNSFRRSVCCDELTFDKDGKINMVKATKQGPAANPGPTTAPATTKP